MQASTTHPLRDHASGRRARTRGTIRIAAASAALAGLSACGSLPMPGFLQSADNRRAAPEETGLAGISVAPRDVEAPEVFRVSDRGLWDGRPSLGGIWVAHPDVTDPERVRIRNEANGQSVTGALFRRERETPGPALQVSSEAAAALGMLAGQPAALDVVALRRGGAGESAPAETGPSAAGPEPSETDAAADTLAATAPPSDGALPFVQRASVAPPAPTARPATIGPAQSAEARAGLLQWLRDAGFTDADTWRNDTGTSLRTP